MRYRCSGDDWYNTADLMDKGQSEHTVSEILTRDVRQLSKTLTTSQFIYNKFINELYFL